MKKTLKILGLLIIVSTILGIMLLGDNLSTVEILLIEFGLTFLGIPIFISLSKDWSKKEPDYMYKVKVEMDQQRGSVKTFTNKMTWLTTYDSLNDAMIFMDKEEFKKYFAVISTKSFFEDDN